MDNLIFTGICFAVIGWGLGQVALVLWMDEIFSFFDKTLGRFFHV